MDLDLEGQPQFEWVFLSRSQAQVNRAMEKEGAVQPPISRMIQPTLGKRRTLMREQPFWDPEKTPVRKQRKLNSRISGGPLDLVPGKISV